MEAVLISTLSSAAPGLLDEAAQARRVAPAAKLAAEIGVGEYGVAVSCADPAYSGWRCAAFLVGSGDVEVLVDVRWNQPQFEPRASVLWLPGGTGGGSFREEYFAMAVQDRLQQEDRIRSVEVAFPDPGGYHALPGGLRGVGLAYQALVERLVTDGIAAGAWRAHVGGSNGATVAVFALAYGDIDRHVARFVLGSGPFMADLARECTDPAFNAFAADPAIRQAIDVFADLPGDPCTHQVLEPDVPYADQSLLGPDARRRFPATSLHVILGANDPNGPWLLRSNALWFEAIEAGDKTKQVVPGLDHDVFGSVYGEPDDAIQGRIREQLYALLRLPPPGTIDRPQLIFSRDPDGPAVRLFQFGETLHGRVEGVGSMPETCIEELPQTAGHCATLAGWGKPSDDWLHDIGDEVWRNVLTAPQHSGQWRGWWRRGEDDLWSASARVAFVDRLVSPTLIFADEPEGLPVEGFAPTDRVYARVTGAQGETGQVCAERIGTDDGHCRDRFPEDLADWIVVDADDVYWQRSGPGIWQTDFRPESLGLQAGAGYRIYWRDPESGLRSNPALLHVLEARRGEQNKKIRTNR